jgi:hypothetical protein
VRHKAFILKPIPRTSHRVALFELTRGRLDVYAGNRSLVAGSLIEYHMPTLQSKRIESISLEFVPLAWGKSDLEFLHHILELCYYFLPLYTTCIQVFALLTFMIDIPPHVWNSTTKKIFIAKLLLLFSLYPQTSLVSTIF